MRGKVTDQDLTDYALNELPPSERLYVESMLAVSEECRGDIYQMLELSEILKEGFEADERKDASGADLLLSDEQRAKVLDVPRWNFLHFLRQAAAIALLAGGTAFVLTRPSFWKPGGTADRIAETGGAVKDFVSEVSERGVARSAEEFNRRILASLSTSASEDMQMVMTPAVCTPTIWSDEAATPDVAGM